MDFQDAPVSVTRIAEGFNVKINGSVHTNVAWLEREFKQITDAKPKKVELDLSGCDFVSSMGMGVFVNLANHIKADGGALHVTAIGKNVFGAFHFSRLDKLFGISPDVVIGDKI